jgi:hypothetical protein
LDTPSGEDQPARTRHKIDVVSDIRMEIGDKMEIIIISLLVAVAVFAFVFWIGAIIFSDRDLLSWDS